MYFGDHPPPHFHAGYQGFAAFVRITDGEVVRCVSPAPCSSTPRTRGASRLRLGALDAALTRGLADADAGRTKSAEEVFDRLEARYRSPPMDQSRT